MSDTSPPITATVRGIGRRALIAAAALLAFVILPPAGYFAFEMLRPQDGDIEAIIRDYGFDPLTPPNQLRGPGALYKTVGTSYQVVCPVDPALLKDKLRKSPTPDRVRTRLESGNLSLGGDFVEQLNGKAQGARVTSVEYSMKDVTISEIAMSHLYEIQNVLLQDPACDKTVQDLLHKNQKVCAGYAALSATTSYKVHYDGKLESSAEAKMPLVNALRDKIEADAGSQIHVQSEDELTGENLYYGIQLWELCITPDTATEPSKLRSAAPPPAPGAQASLAP
jgi:hypothetical protein